ncbi:VOC family protein [Auraticoccus monumenti]|uniref:Glyoxalase-like domain-containing protein n=1 Tax=Auraticoccus monumenti TaxID=675864 RepID=A0A1G6RR73_9ACTN|nr:VOC family protein [Auraticoccus monumenti]SDD06854.1 Glyoxalase-like domain-containing protein [Auraticoccus monumenti]
MHVDHLSYACGPEGLTACADRLASQLGVEALDGGFHPRFGTRNRIIPLQGPRYLEVVEVLDHPASDKAPFGQAVRARSAQGGGWLGWVIALDGERMSAFEERLGRPAVDGHRVQPDGTVLQWRQLGVKGLQSDPQLPFFVEWQSPEEVRPSALDSSVELVGLELAGNPDRVEDWLGGDPTTLMPGLPLSWAHPSGQPGLASATFDSATGQVTI